MKQTELNRGSDYTFLSRTDRKTTLDNCTRSGLSSATVAFAVQSKTTASRPSKVSWRRRVGQCVFEHIKFKSTVLEIDSEKKMTFPWASFLSRFFYSTGKFDYILLETTGLADPGPVASIFWLDDELGLVTNSTLFC